VTHPDVRFVLVGGGRDEAALRAAAAGLPNVVFTGEVRDVPTYLAAFDLFIYPSRHEGMGSALLDAMVAGLPIVATRVGGIPEIVRSGANGLLCEVDDIPGLASAVLALHADAGLRSRFGATNRAAAADYSPGNMTARYMELYDAVLRRATP
jgi:glycosyltransferase involved in cell wall biosynthesis